MSNHNSPSDDGIPRFEPWLAVVTGSLVPLIVSFFVTSLFVPLVVIAVVVFAVGLVMLKRQNSANIGHATTTQLEEL